MWNVNTDNCTALSARKWAPLTPPPNSRITTTPNNEPGTAERSHWSERHNNVMWFDLKEQLPHISTRQINSDEASSTISLLSLLAATVLYQAPRTHAFYKQSFIFVPYVNIIWRKLSIFKVNYSWLNLYTSVPSLAHLLVILHKEKIYSWLVIY